MSRHPRKVLIANRGEIACRIAAAAEELGFTPVGVRSHDDDACVHVRQIESCLLLPDEGPQAYLDKDAIIAMAKRESCELIHPGYGFLSENPQFARACEEANVGLVGPGVDVLDLFGDKARARSFAEEQSVAVIPGVAAPASVAQIEDFVRHQKTDVLIKAVSGGGGRGMRKVAREVEVADAWRVCAREALGAFGDDRLYAERFISAARHLEVQIIGDGATVLPLQDRDCSAQRRRQKLIEIAPAVGYAREVRDYAKTAALKLAAAAHLKGLCTFEFLVTGDGEVFFMEANPRLQVEHTVTEEVTGLDLVQLQLRVACGETLQDCGLKKEPRTRGHAIQLRVNAEGVTADGVTFPAHGTITNYEPPTGAGIRVDGAGYCGLSPNPRFDSLLAKVIVFSQGGFENAASKAARSLKRFRVEGVETTIPFLSAIIADPVFLRSELATDYIDANIAAFAAEPANIDDEDVGDDTAKSPISGIVADCFVAEGQLVRAGEPLFTVEAMKMHHEVAAPRSGRVLQLLVRKGEQVKQGQSLARISAFEVEDQGQSQLNEPDTRLDALSARLQSLEDEARPGAVARRRALGRRTARENVADLTDDGSFVEYGALAIAAQRGRRSEDDLRINTPADGVITGFGSVNGAWFPPHTSRTAVVAYDATVLAGTQGYFGHKKIDRLLGQAQKFRTPVVLYCEGGGGRPGDTDPPIVAMLDVPTFSTLASLAGRTPLVGIAAGYCFAGNAVLLGLCDTIIATRDANIGMSGPAMIEGAGLGKVDPKEVGPVEMHKVNGVIDIAALDEADATAKAKKYLAYFQGAMSDWRAHDQDLLRKIVPADRRRAYDIRRLIEIILDVDSGLELRESFGKACLTILGRIEGRAIGVIANNCVHIGGAIDADAAEKIARFMQLCNAFGLPVASFVDTPGFMVGNDAERSAQLRKSCRMLRAGAALATPFVSIFVRRGYGLGAQSMAAGGFHAPVLSVAWPSGEFGAMGLEGGVKLGFRKELDMEQDSSRREALYRELLAAAYEKGKAINMASMLEIDGVIDPAQTRGLLATTFASLHGCSQTPHPMFLDTW